MEGLTGVVGFVGETVKLGAFDDCHRRGTRESETDSIRSWSGLT